MTHQTTGRRWLRRFTTGTTTAGLMLLAVPATLEHRLPAPSGTDDATTAAPVQLVGHNKPHPNRKIKRYRVRPGDTPGSIAVRYHAWTAQLIRMNHTSTLYAGQVIRVPVVVKASRACDRHRSHRTGLPHFTQAGHGAGPAKHAKPKPKPKPHKAKPHKPKKKAHAKRHLHRHHTGWTHEDASRAKVRKVILTKSGRIGVNPDLALAIAWQESGWQQHRVSSAGALGVMQVMPGTGRWMSLVAGRKLHLRDLHHNVTAGVLLIRTLRNEAKLKHAVAGYYQGLGGVRRDGMYPSTKRYVANVLHLKMRIAQGWNPA